MKLIRIVPPVTNTQPINLTVIIPVSVPDHAYMRGLDACFEDWFRRLGGIHVIVVDDSSPPVFHRNAEAWQDFPVAHFRTAAEYRTGTNNKANAIQAALHQVATSYAFLMDDDLRPDADDLSRVRCALDHFPLVRARVYCRDLPWYECMNLCEQYLARTFDDRWQPFGHIGIRMQAFQAAGMFDKNVIFDDLEIERHFREHGVPTVVLNDFAIPLVSHGFRHFCRQRLVYAYETMAFPFMFGFLKSILPVAALLSMISAYAAAGWIAFVSVSCWVTALVGWRRIRNEHLPWHTTLGAFPLVLSYAVMVWAASCWRLAGGVWFGGGRQRFVPGEIHRSAVLPNRCTGLPPESVCGRRRK